MLDKSKAPLALMEQVLMVLFFAIAASVVLRAFAWCGTHSKGLEQEDRCFAAAMTACEAVRAGDAGLLGINVPIDSDFDVDVNGCTVSVRYRDEGEYMWIAEVTTSDGNASTRLEVAGQKPGTGTEVDVWNE